MISRLLGLARQLCDLLPWRRVQAPKGDWDYPVSDAGQAALAKLHREQLEWAMRDDYRAGLLQRHLAMASSPERAQEALTWAQSLPTVQFNLLLRGLSESWARDPADLSLQETLLRRFAKLTQAWKVPLPPFFSSGSRFAGKDTATRLQEAIDEAVKRKQAELDAGIEEQPGTILDKVPPSAVSTNPLTDLVSVRDWLQSSPGRGLLAGFGMSMRFQQRLLDDIDAGRYVSDFHLSQLAERYGVELADLKSRVEVRKRLRRQEAITGRVVDNSMPEIEATACPLGEEHEDEAYEREEGS